MRRPLFVLFLFVTAVASPHARLADGPAHTILWNQFTAISCIDSFAIGVGPKALVVCAYNDSLKVFEPVEFVFMETDPRSLKRQGRLLMVSTADAKIAFYDLTHLPDLRHVGTIAPGVDFADFVVHGKDIYVSRWFDGIWRFSFDNFESAQFVDSSLTGVLITQLEVDEDTLYALDRYNGIMRYALTGGGFGRFLDYLWVPFSASSFVRHDSQVIIASVEGGVYEGVFGRSGSGITDVISHIDYAQKILVTDSFYVFLNYRSMEVRSRDGDSVVYSRDLSGHYINGDVFDLEGHRQLVLPADPGGLTMFELGDEGRPQAALYPIGRISDFVMHNKVLFAGGKADPISAYAVDGDAQPRFAYTMYDGLGEVLAMDNNGDSLIVYYPSSNRVAIIAHSSDPDSFYIGGSAFVQDTEVTNVQVFDQRIDTVFPLLAIGPTRIQAYALTDSSGIYRAGVWRFVGRILTTLVYDTLAFVSTEKNQLWIGHITPSFNFEFRAILDFPGKPYAMAVLDGHLAVFAYSDLLLFDYSNPVRPLLDTVISLSMPVVDVERRKDRLYTVGPEGVAIYELDGHLPALIESGGRGGTMIEVDGETLATSNGGAVHIYRLDGRTLPTPEPPPLPTEFVLAQNYPNPFNQGTVIEYSLPTASKVTLSIYNILGENVTSLVEREQASGRHFVSWDGTDHHGNTVSSGVYFYRLLIGNSIGTKKMLYLK
ncbi:MAG TPA: T9SS type A sorting domain-containing protein [Candidatus Deferrimicrobium sp.]|nr:T9SS type A sorting domain-containing protein [Candidatus Deferrimicrobium sp.]